MNHLRNAWYVAGFGDELAPGQLLARTLLGEPLVFFRGPDGHAAALQPRAVAERGGLLWLWGGDAAAADEARVPDLTHVTSAPADATIRGHMPTACDWRLLVDNIMDLTHADFLHAGSLGSGAITRVRPQVTEPDAHSVRVAWLSSGDRAPEAFDTHLRLQEQPTDQWTEVTWTVPGVMLLRVGATLQGEPRANVVDTANLHLATPESEGRTHYWYWSTRNFAIDPQANEAIRQMVEHAFSQQDKPMLEAQQRRIGNADFWSLKPVLLPSDAGAVRARRKLDTLIAAEAAR